jgi:iron(III) transport system permease protein
MVPRHIGHRRGVDVIVNTVVLTVVAPLMVLFFSFMISWVVVRTRVRGRKIVDLIAMLPHAIPGLGFAFALTIRCDFGGEVGAMDSAVSDSWDYRDSQCRDAVIVRDADHECGVVAGRERTGGIAQVCGAKRLGTMWWVVAPLVRSSLIFGGLWTGLLVFREISLPLMLSGPRNRVLSVRIWQAWEQGHLSEASALGVVMVLVMGTIVFIAQRAWHVSVAAGTRPHAV